MALSSTDSCRMNGEVEEGGWLGRLIDGLERIV